MTNILDVISEQLDTKVESILNKNKKSDSTLSDIKDNVDLDETIPDIDFTSDIRDMVIEKTTLDARISKMNKIITYHIKEFSITEQAMMIEQTDYMVKYSEILLKRIEYALDKTIQKGEE